MKGGSSKISCMGIVGDGCGGGREFIVEDETLYAYDSQANQSITLLEKIIDAKSISKKACIIRVECLTEIIEFDLSAMKRLA